MAQLCGKYLSGMQACRPALRAACMFLRALLSCTKGPGSKTLNLGTLISRLCTRWAPGKQPGASAFPACFIRVRHTGFWGTQ